MKNEKFTKEDWQLVWVLVSFLSVLLFMFVVYRRN